MIPFYKALDLILNHTYPLSTTTVPILKASGRALAEDVYAPFPLPRFSNSAVDGYGVRSDDYTLARENNPIPIDVVETIPAGQVTNLTLNPRQAVRIFTGAPIPDCVDAVVMREEVENEGILALKRPVKKGENIRQQGEEFAQGDLMLEKGTILNPGAIGLCALVGIDTVRVHTPPSVAIIVTGSEIVPYGRSLSDGQIYDANTPILLAMLSYLNIKPTIVEHVADDLEETIQALKRALSAAEVIIVSGGVSMGDLDFVSPALQSLGVRKVFHKVAMKPGKPNWFGVIGEEKPSQWVFGLPGNPVAVLISYHQLVKPALLTMMGYKHPLPFTWEAILTETITKKDRRREFVRIRLEPKEREWLATPTRGQDSHMLGGVTKANGIAHFPEERSILEKGEKVLVQFLLWDRP